MKKQLNAMRKHFRLIQMMFILGFPRVWIIVVNISKNIRKIKEILWSNQILWDCNTFRSDSLFLFRISYRKYDNLKH